MSVPQRDCYSLPDRMAVATHRFEVFQVPLPWQDALVRCEQLNGTLAAVRSSVENEQLGRLLGPYTLSVWIGASHMAAGKWQWSSGLPIEYTAWSPGEPNSYSGSACAQRWHTPGLHTFDGGWAARPCEYAMPYACEHVLPTAEGASEPPPTPPPFPPLQRVAITHHHDAAHSPHHSAGSSRNVRPTQKHAGSSRTRSPHLAAHAPLPPRCRSRVWS